jgi:aminobenzoyl-glutamate utilization protein A
MLEYCQQSLGGFMTSMVQLRRHLHARPELAFTEVETAARVINELSGVVDELLVGEAVCDISGVPGLPGPDELEGVRTRALSEGVSPQLVETLGHACTGVVATIRGSRKGPTVGIRFDMDALAVPEHEGPEHLPAREGFQSTRPGLMHACGHDGHVAIGIELGRRLAADRNFPGEVLLVFQPAEEGVRGARAMVAAGAVSGVDVMLGLHLGIDLPVGTVAASADGVLATQKLRVELRGRPAHAALAPHLGRNALLGAAAASLALHGLPPHPDAVTRVNVGALNAGTAASIVPGYAVMECELRADDESVLSWLRERAREVFCGAAAMYQVEATVHPLGAATVARCDPEVVRALTQAAPRAPGVETILPGAPMHASDDVTLFMADVQARGGRATFALVGASSPAPHHHPRFDVAERALWIAVDWLELALRTGL